MFASGCIRFHGGVSGIRPGSVTVARYRDAKYIKQIKLVVIERMNITMKRSFRESSRIPLRFEVKEKLKNTQAVMENVVNAIDRPFMTKSFFPRS